MTDDRRYQMRFRPERSQFVPDIAGDDETMGVWDTIEKRFVKRDPKTGEWVPEA